MTPNFALSLSFDGIRLMHRVTGGWHLVGEVALDDPDLTAALGHLRKTALALEPGGLRTKLLLPNDQIKYLSIDTTQTTIDDIHQILNGATPYSIDDLVIDFDRSGGRTHIAAVARETLAEAETFASQHRFSPVCFAAVAEPYTFSGEVFFGMTKSAAKALGEGVNVDRDSAPVVVIGTTSMPVPKDVSGAMPLTTQVTPQPPAAPKGALDEKAEEIADATKDESPADPALPADKAADAEPATIPDAKPESKPSVKEPTTPSPSQPTLPDIDEPVFTSRFRPAATATADPVDTPAPPPAASPVTQAADEADPPPEPLFTRRKPDVAAAAAPAPAIAESDAPAIPRPIVIDPPAVGATTVTARAPEYRPADVIPTAHPAADPAPSWRERFANPAKTTPAPAPIGPIGGKQAIATRGKPRYLGLMLTAGLLVLLALVALWASTLDEDGLAGLLGFGSDETEIVAVNPPVDATNVVAPTEDTPQEVTNVVAVPTTPIVTTTPGRVLSPGEADRIYAATGVWQRSPRLPAIPGAEMLEGVDTFAELPTVAPLGRPRDLVRAGQATDIPFLAPPNPAPAGVIVPRDENGFILAAATGTVMPNGVVVYARAPKILPPERPGAAVAADTPPTDDAAATTDDLTAQGLVLIAGQPDVVPPLRPTTLVNPDDIAVATPDDPATAVDLALDPDTISDAIANAVAEAATPGAVALAAFRPNVRPAGLAPEVPFADPALAGLRPSLRPEGLAPPQTEEDPAVDVAEVPEEPETPAAPDINSVIAAIAAAAPPSALVNPTGRAIVASPRPDPRPNNFARVVASAEQNTARQQTAAASTQAAPAAAAATAAPAAAAASSAAARPTGPVPQGVAAAATLDSAINLSSDNLIGVYGRPNNRRALIRLSNGSYVKVEIGSAYAGGQITAIGDNALNYVVRGQTYSLQVPSSG